MKKNIREMNNGDILLEAYPLDLFKGYNFQFQFIDPKQSYELEVVKRLFNSFNQDEVDEYFFEIHKRFGMTIGKHPSTNKECLQYYLGDAYNPFLDKLRKYECMIDDFYARRFLIDLISKTLMVSVFYFKLNYKYYKNKFSDINTISYDLNNTSYLKAIAEQCYLDRKHYSEFVINKLIDNSLNDKTHPKLSSLLKTLSYRDVDISIIRKINPKIIRKYNLEQYIYFLDIDFFAKEMLASKLIYVKDLVLKFLPKDDPRLGLLIKEKNEGLLPLIIEKIPVEYLAYIIGNISKDQNNHLLIMAENRIKQEEFLISISENK